MSISITSKALTQRTKKIEKTRYFSIELYCMDMLPETHYDLYVDGVLMNDFCKPFGKNLGDPMVAGKDGKLLVQYHMCIPYDQQYLTQSADESGYVAKNKVIEFRDPQGRASMTYLPIRVKGSS